jgi:hypothetical protein
MHGRCEGSGEGWVLGVARLIEAGFCPLRRAFEFGKHSAASAGLGIATINSIWLCGNWLISAAWARARCSADGGDEHAKQNE